MILCCCAAPLDNSWELKDYIPLLSSFIVIALFIVDRFLVSRNRKKETDKNWYLKVLLEPKLSEIDEFYSNIELQYKKSSVHLRSQMDAPLNEYVKLLALEILEFKELKRNFDLRVFRPIIARYKNTGEKLTLKIR